jgi:2-phospho-L-lactate guanylyltransferase
LKTCAIIPVKSFSKAKTRLNIPQIKREAICKEMLEEVLQTLSKCKSIDNIVIVSKDDAAIKLSESFGATQIFDDDLGVNQAVDLADQHLADLEYNCSVIFPQDIPIMESSDIDSLLGFLKSRNSVMLVPSRQFNGTNALVRYYVNSMKTQYDKGSYSYQLDAAKHVTQNVSIALIRRMMLDIDDEHDLAFMLKQNEKPDFCKKIRDILSL